MEVMNVKKSLPHQCIIVCMSILFIFISCCIIACDVEDIGDSIIIENNTFVNNGDMSIVSNSSFIEYKYRFNASSSEDERIPWVVNADSGRWELTKIIIHIEP